MVILHFIGKLAATSLRLSRNTISCDPKEEYVGIIQKEILQVKAELEMEK